MLSLSHYGKQWHLAFFHFGILHTLWIAMISTRVLRKCKFACIFHVCIIQYGNLSHWATFSKLKRYFSSIFLFKCEIYVSPHLTEIYKIMLFIILYIRICELTTDLRSTFSADFRFKLCFRRLWPLGLVLSGDMQPSCLGKFLAMGYLFKPSGTPLQLLPICHSCHSEPS